MKCQNKGARNFRANNYVLFFFKKIINVDFGKSCQLSSPNRSFTLNTGILKKY